MFKWLFGCFHRFGFPITVPKRRLKDPWVIAAAKPTGTYVVCLKCGQEFPYDWENMRVVKSAKQIKRMILHREEVA